MPILSNYKLRGQKGQITAEYLLLGVFLIALFSLVTKTLRDNDHLKDFQEGPQRVFKSMVENGNLKQDLEESRKEHPNQEEMHFTPDGED